MTATLIWTDSTWSRVCAELFSGDERSMLAWGRRYLASYPDVQGAEFHLGSAFRDIVGARNRSQWWRTAVELLEARTGADGVRRFAHQVSEPAVAEAPVRSRTIDARADDRARRLAVFDAGTERQRERERAAGAGSPSASGRGWTRADLYE